MKITTSIFFPLLLLLLSTLTVSSCSEKEITYSNKITLGSSSVDNLISPQDLDFEEAKVVLEKRLDNIGLKEFKVEIKGDEKKVLQVSYNGELDETKLNQVLSRSTEIGFYATYDLIEIIKGMEQGAIDFYLMEKLQEENPEIEVDSLYLAENMAEVTKKYFPAFINFKKDYGKHEAVFIYSLGEDTAAIWKAMHDPIIVAALSDLYDLKWSWALKSESLHKTKGHFFALYGLKIPFDNEKLISSKHIESVLVKENENSKIPVLNIQLNSKGKELLKELTDANYKRQISIVQGGKVISAPFVQQTIEGGEMSISGNFSKGELDQMKILLSNPPFPFPIDIVPNID